MRSGQVLWLDSCKPRVAGSIPSFSRTTFGLAFRCSRHKIHTQIITLQARVYTCQNATLLEITCRGSYTYGLGVRIQCIFLYLKNRRDFNQKRAFYSYIFKYFVFVYIKIWKDLSKFCENPPLLSPRIALGFEQFLRYQAFYPLLEGMGHSPGGFLGLWRLMCLTKMNNNIWFRGGIWRLRYHIEVSMNKMDLRMPPGQPLSPGFWISNLAKPPIHMQNI